MTQVTGYGYAVSRLRAMENRLLDNAFFQRLLDSEGISDALKALGETYYSRWLTDEKGTTDVEHAIFSELQEAYDEVRRFSPDPELPQLCRLPYDIHNIKVLLKGQIQKQRGSKKRRDLLTNLGNVSVDDLVVAVESEDYRLLPLGFHRIVPECIMHWEQTHDILSVETMLDSHLFSMLRQLAEKAEHEGIETWVRAKIDAENVRNIFRLKRIEMDTGQAAPFLHDGGWISRDRILSLMAEPVEGWGRILGFADVSTAFRNLPEAGNTDDLIVDLEKALDDYITGVLGPYRYSTFAPENILTYLWAKEIESKNVRIILVGVSNDVDRDSLRRLLRNVR
ncbi:MAG: V-type ATPase subunit [Thermovirgaceae bacterium]